METPIERLLETLGISAVADWDVLVFVRRHGTTIASDANMVGLIGYSPSVIEAALNGLTKAGLIQSSRSDGTGLYKFVPPDTPAGRDCLDALTKMADRRSGRLQLIGALRNDRQKSAVKGRTTTYAPIRPARY